MNLANFSSGTLTGGVWFGNDASTFDLESRQITTLATGTSVQIANGTTFDALNTLANKQGNLTIGYGQQFNVAGALTKSGES